MSLVDPESAVSFVSFVWLCKSISRLRSFWELEATVSFVTNVPEALSRSRRALVMSVCELDSDTAIWTASVETTDDVNAAIPCVTALLKPNPPMETGSCAWCYWHLSVLTLMIRLKVS